MKPPTIKLNKNYSVKYIQIPYDNRYYVIMRGEVECCKITNTETEFLWLFIQGIYSKLEPLEVVDLARRFEKFQIRVKKKNELLDK